MTRAERFLERQAEQSKREWEEAQRATRKLPSGDLQGVALRDAPSEFKKVLSQILHEFDWEASYIHPALSEEEVDENGAKVEAPKTFTATVVGSSQQGKTSLLNSLLRLFGYNFRNQRTFPDVDLLPTHSKNRAGLAFPLKLEYHEIFELRMERWTADELAELMQIVAGKALDSDPDFFEFLEFGEVEKGSFLEFVGEHGQVDAEGNYISKPSAAEILQADGGLEYRTFVREGLINPSLEVLKSVFDFLLTMADQQWFRYKLVTLRCPSHLLKQMQLDDRDASLLDLPGVGIVHDNNYLVEELVLRNVAAAETIIVLTGQRSFTQDILRVLRASVFERLLDPAVVPPPTVAVSNSQLLIGMQEEEMEDWRRCTLHGNMGWYKELQSFAEERFSSFRRHRSLADVEPSLFPNDLWGFLDQKLLTEGVGVAFLVGYFMRLPQETILSYVTNVLERAHAYKSTLDELWQAPILVDRHAGTSRLFKEAIANRKEGFDKDLQSKLTFASIKQMFDWEVSNSFEMQMVELAELVEKELGKSRLKFDKFIADGKNLQQEVPLLVKHILLEAAGHWDNVIGIVAFERFLAAARNLANLVYEGWVPQLFDENSRSAGANSKVKNTSQALLNAMQAKVSKVIVNDVIKYTFTDSFRQQVRNLHVRGHLKCVVLSRKMQRGVTPGMLWGDIENAVRKKLETLEVLLGKIMKEPTNPVKKLVIRLKTVILEIFDICVKDFKSVTNALESIAQGGRPSDKDPHVTLQTELSDFTSQLTRYLEKHRKMRDKYGAEELKVILQARSDPFLRTSGNEAYRDDDSSKRARV